jgi:hypothetical protein
VSAGWSARAPRSASAPPGEAARTRWRGGGLPREGHRARPRRRPQVHPRRRRRQPRDPQRFKREITLQPDHGKNVSRLRPGRGGRRQVRDHAVRGGRGPRGRLRREGALPASDIVWTMHYLQGCRRSRAERHHRDLSRRTSAGQDGRRGVTDFVSPSSNGRDGDRDANGTPFCPRAGQGHRGG